MSALEFQPWPKIARLNRIITITEKLDGTNAAVVIVDRHDLDHVQSEHGIWHLFDQDDRNATAFVGNYVLFAQSRKRFITPRDDNYGFAGWVERNAQALVEVLGAGTHFGEWWGAGIQRGYGLIGKDAPNGNRRFSLFNAVRWEDEIDPFEDHPKVPGLRRVPIIYRGLFSQKAVDKALTSLRETGSHAEEGFARPEGIVIFHEDARQSFKVTLEGDEVPKGAAGHRYDEEAKAA